MASGSDIIQKALEGLQCTVTPQDRAAFECTKLEDVYNEARRIEREQSSRTSLTNMRRIEPVLTILQSYAGVIDTFCQGFTPMVWVWGPIKLMLTLASQHVEIIKKLLQALQDITEVLPRIDKLKKMFSDDGEFKRILGLVYEDLLEFFQRTYKFFRRRAWAQWFEASWRLFDRRFSSIVNKLAGHCEMMDKQAAVIHYAEMKEERDRRRLEDAEYEKARQQRMTGEVISWLSSAADSQENFLHNLADSRQLGTCNWILENPDIQSWIEDDGGRSAAWMTGIPGAGKSVVCSFLVEHLQAQSSASVLYFFCGQSSVTGNDIALALRTLAVQCLRQNHDMAPLVHDILIDNGSNKSIKEIKSLLSKLLVSVGRTRVLLDGVDELEPEVQMTIIKALADTLGSVQATPGSSCKILVSSRKLPEIEKALPKNKSCIALDARPENSIELFIDNHVAALKEHFEEFDGKIFVEVSAKFRAKAQGMFLWVRLVSEMLKAYSTEDEFQEALNKLPDGLEQAYGLILKRLNKRPAELRARSFRILYWLCVAYVSVNIHEVADGIALKPGQIKLSRKNRSQNLKRDILDICAPIVEQNNDDTLKLVHFSAKEYLLDLRSGVCREVPDSPYLEISQAHHDIAFACVANLTAALCFIPRHSRDYSDQDLQGIILRGEVGLQKYGHRFWIRHVLDYLKHIAPGDLPGFELVEMLEKFALVRKNESSILCEPLLQKASAPTLDIRKLFSQEEVQDLLLKTLLLDAKRKVGGPVFQSCDVQTEWALREDLTFLSLIDARVQTITEELLSLDPNNLPSHIDQADFRKFTSRFRFPCRILGCQLLFQGMATRNNHESAHLLTYQCSDCDFSARGFKSKRDLEKHKERYHLSVEDFTVPETIRAEPTSYQSSHPGRSDSNKLGRSNRLNERGQKALEQGIRKVLDRFSKQLAPQVLEAHSSAIPSPASSTGEFEVPDNLAHQIRDMEDKINNHSYQSLRDFEDDMRRPIQLSQKTQAFDSSQVSMLCEQAFKSVLGTHPLFAPFGTEQQQTLNSSSGSLGVVKLGIDISNFNTKPSTSPGDSICDTQTSYWPKVEESEFPALLQRFKMDFTTIADYLKTKSSDEVKIHFEQLIEANDSRIIALLDDLKAQIDAGQPNDKSDSESEAGTRTDNGTSLTSTETPYYWGQMNPQLLVKDRIQSGGTTPTIASIQARGQTNPDDRPTAQKYVRKRPKIRCPYCDEEKILSNEHALVRHMQSFHQRTQDFWTCRDVSADMQFLADCAACAGGKKYPTKKRAVDHLRSAHFLHEPNTQLLDLWINEEVKQNRNFKEIKHDKAELEKNDTSDVTQQPEILHPKSLRLLPELPALPQYPYEDPLGSLRQLGHSRGPQDLNEDLSKSFENVLRPPDFEHSEASEQLPSLQSYLDQDDRES